MEINQMKMIFKYYLFILFQNKLKLNNKKNINKNKTLIMKYKKHN